MTREVFFSSDILNMINTGIFTCIGNVVDNYGSLGAAIVHGSKGVISGKKIWWRDKLIH